MKRTFEEWKQEVNQVLILRTGVDADDLPDCPYRDWYDRGVSPKSAALRAIKAAQVDR